MPKQPAQQNHIRPEGELLYERCANRLIVDVDGGLALGALWRGWSLKGLAGNFALDGDWKVAGQACWGCRVARLDGCVRSWRWKRHSDGEAEEAEREKEWELHLFLMYGIWQVLESWVKRGDGISDLTYLCPQWWKARGLAQMPLFLLKARR